MGGKHKQLPFKQPNLKKTIEKQESVETCNENALIPQWKQFYNAGQINSQGESV